MRSNFRIYANNVTDIDGFFGLRKLTIRCMKDRFDICDISLLLYIFKTFLNESTILFQLQFLNIRFGFSFLASEVLQVFF